MARDNHSSVQQAGMYVRLLEAAAAAATGRCDILSSASAARRGVQVGAGRD